MPDQRAGQGPTERADINEPFKGDFALLNPLPILRDEDGEYHCPAPVMNRDLTIDEDDAPRVKAMCGEPLAVHWTVVTTVPEHDGPEHTIEAKDASGWAIWSAWELKCAHGHVLATSADTYGSDEEAQPFDSRHWWGTP